MPLVHQAGGNSTPAAELEFPTELLCPNCGEDAPPLIRLTAKELGCRKCEARYPLLLGAAPVLLNNPATHLMSAGAALLKQMAELENEINEIKDARAKKSYRAQVRTKYEVGYETNLNFITKMKDCVTEHIGTDDRAKSFASGEVKGRNRTGYRDFSQNMIRDWSGFPECEKEIKSTIDSIETQLKAAKVDEDLLVVLGAGCGRFAEELSYGFRSTVAVDLSIPMAASYYMVRERLKETFYEINEKDALTTAGQMRRAEFRQTSFNPNLIYCVANAFHMPVRAGTVSSLVSIFFTDVVPTVPLIRQARNLLKPGGNFVHFGPLQYHYIVPSMYFSYQELLSEFASFGFNTQTFDCVDMVYCMSEARLSGTWHRNTRFNAVKMDVTLDTVLAIRKEVKISRDGGSSVTFTIDRPGEGTQEYSGVLAQVLSRVDGRRNVGQTLHEMSGGALNSNSSVAAKGLGLFEKLVGLGVVQFVPSN